MAIHRVWDLLSGKVTGWMRDFVLLLPNLAVAVLALVAFWLAAKLARGILHRFLRRVSHSVQVNHLVAQTAFVALLATGLFVALGILGLEKTVASLLAGAGIIGLALGFAFQDIAANLMAGVYLNIQHPFRAGHLIESKDFFGVVKRVQLRWTEIRNPEGQLVLIPNKQVFENPILNYSATGHRRIDIRLGVSYGDDLEKVRRVGLRAVEQVSVRKLDTEVELFFEEFGESSIDFVVRFWIDFTSKQAEYLQARSEAIERLKAAFDENGITLPFPTRTLDFGVKGGEKLSEVLEGVGSGAGRAGNGGLRSPH
ncbi:MAG TPA: mechanosensitive ion channel family protein [Thermoanaerobaculia bacterium]|jgi:small conductance mechanosensitive channel|nr:mechanosensitive ion channel family protein [Thermoanaerobaculia bacterium]